MSTEEGRTIVPKESDHRVPRKMKTRAEVQQMLRLHGQGHSPYRIAKVLGCSRATVVRYLEMQRWRPRPQRRCLDGLESWLEEHFLQHDGNAEVLVQELCRFATEYQRVYLSTALVPDW